MTALVEVLLEVVCEIGSDMIHRKFGGRGCLAALGLVALFGGMIAIIILA